MALSVSFRVLDRAQRVSRSGRVATARRANSAPRPVERAHSVDQSAMALLRQFCRCMPQEVRSSPCRSCSWSVRGWARGFPCRRRRPGCCIGCSGRSKRIAFRLSRTRSHENTMFRLERYLLDIYPVYGDRLYMTRPSLGYTTATALTPWLKRGACAPRLVNCASAVPNRTKLNTRGTKSGAPWQERNASTKWSRARSGQSRTLDPISDSIDTPLHRSSTSVNASRLAHSFASAGDQRLGRRA